MREESTAPRTATAVKVRQGCFAGPLPAGVRPPTIASHPGTGRARTTQGEPMKRLLLAASIACLCLATTAAFAKGHGHGHGGHGGGHYDHGDYDGDHPPGKHKGW